MTLRFASLGSGSKGNATLIEYRGTRVLVDCGFNVRETERRLQRLGLEVEALDAILVTHEHSDHLGGVARLARRSGAPVYMTHGTFSVWNDTAVPAVVRFAPHQDFSIGHLEVRPYPVPHDAREPCQYVLVGGGLSLGILSDAGHVTPYMRAMLAECDGLMLECNHDPELLSRGPYPPSLKVRVGGDRGHLSNQQAADLLGSVDLARLQHLVLTHLSETNNTPDHALSAVSAPLSGSGRTAVCAGQQAGLDWRELRPG